MKETIASLTIFRNQADLDAYFAELNEPENNPEGEAYEPDHWSLPPFPFAGRVILDDNLFFVDFITLTPDDAIELGLALN